MYASEIFKESAFSLALPTERIRQLLTHLRSALLLWRSPKKVQALHDVLRLDVVSALGETPAAYGWHVDGLLNVRMRTGREPVREAPEPSSDWEDRTPPARGVTGRVYRVPRTRRRPKLQLLHGGLAGGAA